MITANSSTTPAVLGFLLGTAAAAAASLILFRQKKRQERKILSDDSDALESLLLQVVDDSEQQHKQQKCIYLDYNGTTPVYPNVLRAMLPYLTKHYGNPSSKHALGREPRRAVDQARRQILYELLQAPSDTDESAIWFTGSGTESDNLAIHLALQSTSSSASLPKGGSGDDNKKVKKHIVTSNVEHPAIAGCLDVLEEQGQCQVTRVPVQPDGCVLAEDMIAAIQPNTVLVTLMLANNESGALQPVAPVAQYCRQAGILFHTDAAQAAGKVNVALPSSVPGSWSLLGDVDMVSLVGHKIGAPKGVGCVYVRPGCLEEAGRSMHNHGVLLIGGGQEFGRRGGTENVPYIVGMGAAAVSAAANWKENASHMERLRSRLLFNLMRLFGPDNVRVNGPIDAHKRLPNTLSVGLKDVDSAQLLSAVNEKVAASAGATCHSLGGVSSVLKAMQVPEEFARGTLRLSIGPTTTEQEVDDAAQILADEAARQLGLGEKVHM